MRYISRVNDLRYFTSKESYQRNEYVSCLMKNKQMSSQFHVLSKWKKIEDVLRKWDTILFINFFLRGKRSVSFPLGYVARNYD